MKTLARGCMWWPGMDSDIKNIVQHCEIRQKVQAKSSSAPPHGWNWPAQHLNRSHLDFAGPILGHGYLVVVDACTKWMDVSMMSSITADSTIDKLYIIFATLGLSHTLVSDNYPTFTSEKFKKFCKENGIKHNASAPYHPQTNGLAQCAIQTFKCSTMIIQGSSIQNCIQKFLFRYCITPHPVTNISPFEFLFNRKPFCELDLMIPDVSIFT
uniref:Integrase catalytic domain-containing protein n=1 Tax=Amphimedon queenslandica TaxID=400682 RepID=A0A1X7VSL3_AMPQE